jgi:hypothetical protein
MFVTTSLNKKRRFGGCRSDDKRLSHSFEDEWFELPTVDAEKFGFMNRCRLRY